MVVEAASIGHHGAVAAGLELAVPRLPAVEDVVQHTGSPGFGQELGAEADQPAGRYPVVEADPARSVVDHLRHGSLAQRQELGHDAEIVVGHVDRHPLHRLEDLAVDLAGDHLWLPDRQLEAFTPHRLDQHGQLQLAAAEDFPQVGPIGRCDPDGDVADQFGVEAVLQQAGGELGAVGTRQAATC